MRRCASGVVFRRDAALSPHRHSWSEVPAATGHSMWDTLAKRTPVPVLTLGFTMASAIATYSTLMWLAPPPGYAPRGLHTTALMVAGGVFFVVFAPFRLPSTKLVSVLTK